jgi:hypothetical protein
MKIQGAARYPCSPAVDQNVRKTARAKRGGFRGARNDSTSSPSAWNDGCLDAILVLLLFLSRRAPFSDLEDKQNGASEKPTCGLVR